jgi:hypothetical protein
VHDHDVLAAELVEDLRQWLHPVAGEDTHHLVGGARRIGERAEQVEHGAHAHLAARTDRVAHRPVVHRREHEADADLVDAAGDRLGLQLDHDAGRLEQIGAARAARDRAVAVLGDARVGSGRDEGAGGGDVEGLRRVTAGAAGVHEVLAGDLDARRQLAHHRRRRRDLLHRLALHPQPDQKAADLCLRSVARHDRAHDLGHLLA